MVLCLSLFVVCLPTGRPAVYMLCVVRMTVWRLEHAVITSHLHHHHSHHHTNNHSLTGPLKAAWLPICFRSSVQGLGVQLAGWLAGSHLSSCLRVHAGAGLVCNTTVHHHRHRPLSFPALPWLSVGLTHKCGRRGRSQAGRSGVACLPACLCLVPSTYLAVRRAGLQPVRCPGTASACCRQSTTRTACRRSETGPPTPSSTPPADPKQQPGPVVKPITPTSDVTSC